MLLTMLILLTMSILLSGFIYINYENYFHNKNSNQRDDDNNIINFSNSSIPTNNFDNSSINNSGDDDDGGKSIAVEEYLAGHVFITNGSFLLMNFSYERSLTNDNTTDEAKYPSIATDNILFSNIEQLFDSDYKLFVTDTSDNDEGNLLVNFVIITITYKGEETQVQNVIYNDLYYTFDSSFLYQPFSIESANLTLSADWRVESLDDFKYSSSLPSHVFQINSKASSHFYFLGDWGKGGKTGDITAISSRRELGDSKKNSYTYQVAIANAMDSHSKTFKPDAIITLGDNIYSNGVSSTSDSLWNSLFRDVYLGSSSNLKSIKWFPVLGNHDYGSSSGVQAQIDRTKATDDDEWTMPARNYTMKFKTASNSNVYMIMIDTTTLCPSVTSATNTKGGISESLQAARIKDQLHHIELNLKTIMAEMDQRRDWLFVIGHYPVFSSGQHGDISENIHYLLPLLQAYPVHAYINGHDHMSMHLQQSQGGCHYFVCGAGSMTDSLGTTSAANLIWYGEKYPAFLTASISKYEATFNFINHNRETTYSYSLNKAMFKNYKAYDNYVYTSLLKNTASNGDSISAAILFFILILMAYMWFFASSSKASSSHQKPFGSLLLASAEQSYVSIGKQEQDRMELNF